MINKYKNINIKTGDKPTIKPATLIFGFINQVSIFLLIYVLHISYFYKRRSNTCFAFLDWHCSGSSSKETKNRKPSLWLCLPLLLSLCKEQIKTQFNSPTHRNFTVSLKFPSRPSKNSIRNFPTAGSGSPLNVVCLIALAIMDTNLIPFYNNDRWVFVISNCCWDVVVRKYTSLMAVLID